MAPSVSFGSPKLLSPDIYVTEDTELPYAHIIPHEKSCKVRAVISSWGNPWRLGGGAWEGRSLGRGGASVGFTVQPHKLPSPPADITFVA